MKRLLTLVTTIFLLASLTLAGCASSAKAPKQALQEAFEKSAEVNSAKFDGSMKLNLDLPESAKNDPDAAMALNILNNAELTFRGTSSLEPFMTEVFLSLRLTGDMEMAFNIDMLMTEDKMWVKIPNIPFFPLPDNLVNKYLELDFAQLSELSGEPFTVYDPELQTKYQKLGMEISGLFLGAYDEKTYFTSLSKDEAKLPGGVDANQVIKFELTNENLRPFIETSIELLPQMFEKLLEIEEFPMTQADIDAMKADLEAGKAEMEEALNDIEDAVNINNVSLLTALDKNSFITYSGADVNLDVTVDGETGTFGLNFAMTQSEINKNPAFELSEPDAADVVTMEQLMAQFMGLGF